MVHSVWRRVAPYGHRVRQLHFRGTLNELVSMRRYGIHQSCKNKCLWGILKSKFSKEALLGCLQIGVPPNAIHGNFSTHTHCTNPAAASTQFAERLICSCLKDCNTSFGCLRCCNSEGTLNAFFFKEMSTHRSADTATELRTLEEWSSARSTIKTFESLMVTVQKCDSEKFKRAWKNSMKRLNLFFQYFSFAATKILRAFRIELSFSLLSPGWGRYLIPVSHLYQSPLGSCHHHRLCASWTPNNHERCWKWSCTMRLRHLENKTNRISWCINRTPLLTKVGRHHRTKEKKTNTGISWIPIPLCCGSWRTCYADTAVGHSVLF